MSDSTTPRVLSSAYLRREWPPIREDEVMLAGKRKASWVTLEFGDSVVIAAVTEKKEILLVRQYRHGTQRLEWELPGGAVHPGEPWEDAVRRELLEETGYGAGHVESLLKLNSMTGYVRGTLRLYRAFALEKVADPRPDEISSVEILPIEEVYQRTLRGEYLNAITVSSILYLRATGLL